MPNNGPFVDALKEIGDLTIIRDADEMTQKERADLVRECNILLTIWGSMPVPLEIADDRGSLEYICNISGELRPWIPIEIINAGIIVTNWGDASADSIAEGAATLLLAIVKDIHAQIQVVRNGGWRPDTNRFPGGTLKGLHLGIYGFGAIGRRFAELISPFKPVIHVYDPYINELPAGCMKVNSLYELFSVSQAVAIHAGLCEATAGSVTDELLELLPEHGIIINTARGGIIDQEALFRKLENGRLRAGLDVLADTDDLEADHPSRQWENCIFTAHGIGRNTWNRKEDEMAGFQKTCIENIKRHITGQPLKFVMDRDRYLRST